jgi:hypothetical protein
MEQRDPTTFLLICWLFFLGCATWFDWLGLTSILVAVNGIVATRVVYLALVSIALWQIARAIKTKHYSRFQRSVLILSFVWLVMLPLIPWDATKSLVIRSALLVPGMTKAQVQAIMTAPPEIEDLYGTGEAFCTHRDVVDSNCREEMILVHTRMYNDRLKTVELEIDL